MFPEAEEDAIEAAISTTANIEEAIDTLLVPAGNNNEGTV